MADEYDNLIRESVFRKMLAERLNRFLDAFEDNGYSTLFDKEADMFRSVVSIVSGVLEDIPKIKE